MHYSEVAVSVFFLFSSVEKKKVFKGKQEPVIEKQLCKNQYQGQQKGKN